ncbi:nucleotidyltransferase family protein [Namhaeicola litoreus]|uniref:NDP-sugar synthase n=1 Tax=Namhaeicola litoreus TaxID=1052145 RepID=A0ABW3XYK3_9FLAO
MIEHKTLLIMAGGNGSRYGALKQFDPLGPKGEYLFEYSIFDALHSGFNHIVLVTKEEFVLELDHYLRERLPKEIKIDVVPQRLNDLPIETLPSYKRVKPWGTGHAVWVARDFIKNTFVVINADDFYGRKAFAYASDFMEEYRETGIYGMVPYQLDQTLSLFGSVARGVGQFEDEKLKAINEFLTLEKKENKIIDQSTGQIFTGKERVSMNIWICQPSFFDILSSEISVFLKENDQLEKGEIYIPRVIEKYIQKKVFEVGTTDVCDSWFGVTYAKDKELVINKLVELKSSGEYPSPLWKN